MIFSLPTVFLNRGKDVVPCRNTGHIFKLLNFSLPGEWMAAFNENKNGEGGGKSKEDSEKKEEDESNDGTGDPEIAASYVVHLLPLFIKSYQTSMVTPVRKAALGLIRKMVHYSGEEHLKELAKLSGFASGLVEVLANVIENEVTRFKTCCI